LEKLLAAEDRPMYRVLWLMLATTGLRPDEVRGLIWSDITESEDGWWIRLRQSKTEEGKLPVPVASAVMKELKKVPKRGVYVFSTETGGPLNESNLRRDWVQALAKADLPYTNLYQLRKLFGTLKARTVTDSVLKRLMRHTDARTTKQFYVTALEEDLRRAVEG
jgi:integrase